MELPLAGGHDYRIVAPGGHSLPGTILEGSAIWSIDVAQPPVILIQAARICDRHGSSAAKGLDSPDALPRI